MIVWVEIELATLVVFDRVWNREGQEEIAAESCKIYQRKHFSPRSKSDSLQVLALPSRTKRAECR